ncbi:hypothetical protein BGW80DRAFT_1333880, partial [Lactifluus volemus]
MSPANLPGTVQDSKSKRQERLKSRIRDHRGGIFVPSEGNVLADILLSHGVNGESRSALRGTASKAGTKTKTFTHRHLKAGHTQICLHHVEDTKVAGDHDKRWAFSPP